MHHAEQPPLAGVVDDGAGENGSIPPADGVTAAYPGWPIDWIDLIGRTVKIHERRPRAGKPRWLYAAASAARGAETGATQEVLNPRIGP